MGARLEAWERRKQGWVDEQRLEEKQQALLFVAADAAIPPITTGSLAQRLGAEKIRTRRLAFVLQRIALHERGVVEDYDLAVLQQAYHSLAGIVDPTWWLARVHLLPSVLLEQWIQNKQVSVPTEEEIEVQRIDNRPAPSAVTHVTGATNALMPFEGERECYERMLATALPYQQRTPVQGAEAQRLRQETLDKIQEKIDSVSVRYNTACLQLAGVQVQVEEEAE